MCLYHEEHPNVKQTEIGGEFGNEQYCYDFLVLTLPLDSYVRC